MHYYSENNLTIDELHLHELQAIINLKPSDWSNIIPAFRFYLQNDQCLSLKAVIKDKIVGTGTIIFHENVAWLAHIMVHPDYRGQGIGKKITQTLTKIGLQKVDSILLIATELGKPVYTSLGFDFIDEYTFFNSGSLHLPISDAIRPYDERYYQTISDMDQEITGEKRSDFLKPLLQNSFIYVYENELLAVYYASFGEGLIIARDALAGNLMLILHLLEPKPIVIPSSNSAAYSFLLSNGFTINLDRYACRMTLGKPVNWQPQGLFGRFGGNLG